MVDQFVVDGDVVGIVEQDFFQFVYGVSVIDMFDVNGIAAVSGDDDAFEAVLLHCQVERFSGVPE